VGVGHLGTLHARIYKELSAAELTGVFDLDPRRSGEIARKYKVRSFSSLDELIQAVEAVSLAVPTNRHFEIGRMVLSAGRHLLVEKPITEKTEQAAELVELANAKGLVLQVGHVERFNPALLSAAELISGVLFVESERLAPFNPRGTEVPVVLDLMIHDIDIVLSIMRRPVLDVSALGIPVFTPSVDIANARLTFEGGAVANVAASRVSIKKVRKMRFFASDRYISVDMLQLSAVSYRKRPQAQVTLERSSLPDMHDLVVRENLNPDRSREPLVLELESFIDCIREGKQPVVSGVDGLQALEVAGRIMKAIELSLEKIGLKPDKLAGAQKESKT